VRSGDRAQHEDQSRQAERGGGAVFQQLQSDVIGGELLGGDPGADYDRDQQSGAEELGEQPSSERRWWLMHGHILT
jgi:hypothetical protein